MLGKPRFYLFSSTHLKNVTHFVTAKMSSFAGKRLNTYALTKACLNKASKL